MLPPRGYQLELFEAARTRNVRLPGLQAACTTRVWAAAGADC